MAVPTYVTDLTSITTNEAIGTWVETGTWTTGTAPVLEPDFFIQGANCVAKYWTSGGGGGTPSGAIFDAGSVLTIPTPGAFFVWLMEQCPNNIATEANGGLRVILGDSSTAFRGYYVGGSDTLPYGGWVCIPVDPAISHDVAVGSPGTDQTYQWFGAGVLQTATAKGGLGIDRLMYGRGELKVEFGSTADGYATFTGAAAANDNVTTGRWGLLQAVSGGYLQQGLFLMGSATNAVDFRDGNTSILIANTKKVVAAFNTFEIRNAASRVDWTNVSVLSLGTVSPGKFVVTDNADVNFAGCVFTGMSTFALLGATAMLNCTFRRCDQITAPGSNLSGSLVDAYVGAADTSAVVWNVATDPDGLLDDMTFAKGTNAHHAIEMGTSSPTTMTLRGITFTSFNASNAQNDSVLHVKRTSGTVTINTVNCSGTVSYKSAGATVVIVADPVTALVNVKDNAAANLQNARVLLKAAAGGPFPFDATVTITRSGSTATVAHTSHGMATNDKVVISGASEPEYNGVYSITFVDANSYSYTVSGTPATPATGTIKATFVAISGLTDASGNISASRVYTSAQPVTGWVRKASGSPLFKTSLLGGSVSNTTGYTANVQMILDE